jgi:flavin reductase (DIM6/NTAB) family NADH-FMN oxidoreductase RutF
VKHMPTFRKKNYPVSEIRRYLEPGPVVLVSSAWKGNTNIMTMGWHMVLEFSPSLVACCISNANHSFEMIRRSQECVINVPTTDLVNEVIGIGDCSGAQVDKFKAFGLTPGPATKVSAPLIKECYANFGCRLADGSLFEIRPVHLGGSQSTCGQLPEVSQDRALPGSGRLHDLRPLD